jgi:hypothetical protein
MRRFLLAFTTTTAALVVAVVVYAVVTAPPRALRPESAVDARPLAWGAYHVHSSRSDGSGTVDQIASAAARAGLQFVILTDHGDGTTPIEPARYRHGVLCIDAAEINSDDGHLVALNLQRASPYPLGGTTRDVVEDIRRLGGWSVAAHPDSARPGLRWRSRDVRPDGVEWINADAEWRALPASEVMAAAVRTVVRPPEAIASLFRPPVRGMQRWDGWLRDGRVFGLAALDAHARIGADDEGEAGEPQGPAIAFPRYEHLFRTLAQVVALEAPLTGDPRADGAAVMAAIGGGRTYSVLRAFADVMPPLAFTATAPDGMAQMGGTLASSGAVVVRAEVRTVPAARVTLVRAGRVVASGPGRVEYAVPAQEAGAYRLEAFVDERPMPWIVTNPIYVGSADRSEPAAPRTPAADPAPTSAPLRVAPETWQIEAHPASTARTSVDGSALHLDYRLGDGVPAGQYVALATSAAGERAIDRIDFVASSARPMRLSVQVRLPGGTEGQRWRRSVYVDETPRQFSIRLADLEPVSRSSPLRPVVARVQSVLLVVDTVNARPGTEGRLSLSDVRLMVVENSGVDPAQGPARGLTSGR